MGFPESTPTSELNPARFPLWERFAWLVVVLCLFGGPIGKVVMRWLDPLLAAEAAFWGDLDPLVTLDPWGRKYVERVASPKKLATLRNEEWPEVGRAVGPNDWVFYFFGPNGVDDRGTKDDVLIWHSLTPTIEIFYSRGPNRRDEGGGSDDQIVFGPRPKPITAREWRILQVAIWLREPLLWVGLSLLLAWLLRGPYTRRPRSPQLRVEALRAGVLALGPVVALTVAAVWVADHVAPQVIRAVLPEDRFLIPVPYAVFGSLVAFVLLAAFGWRLRRAPEESEESEPPSGPEDSALESLEPKSEA
ncbi:MAG: hypothetical protein JKY65_30015 [Planctomycetes bacterium]|nr:hypothetical protein [Planctomycetota bacterium]